MKLYDHYVFPGSLFAAACIIIFVWITYSNMHNTQKENDKADAALKSLRSLELILDDMQDLETGQRGYIISGKKSFLEPYYKALRNIKADSTLLRSVMSDQGRAQDIKKLQSLIKYKLAFTKTLISTLNSAGSNSSADLVRSEKGKTVMDSIRQLVSSLESNERTILTQSNMARQTLAIRTNRLFFILAFVSLIVLGINFLTIRRNYTGQQEYQKQLTYMSTLVEQTADAILSTDPGFIIRSWNRSAEKMYGFSSEEAIGKRLRTLIGSTLTDDQRQSQMKDLQSQGFYQHEFEFRHKNGQPICVLASVSVLRNKYAQITGYVAIHRDITERKHLENQLQKLNEELETKVTLKTIELTNVLEEVTKSNQRFETIARATNDAVWEIDLLTGESRHNETFLSLFSPAPDKHLIPPTIELWRTKIHPDDRERVLSSLHMAYAGSTDRWADEFRFLKPDGSYGNFYDRGFIFRNEAGTAIRMIGSMIDISDRKKAEMELAISEEKYRLLFESSPLPMWIYEIETGKILGVNQAALQQYGYTMQEFLALTIYDIRPEEEAVKLKNWQKTIGSATLLNAGYWIHKKKNGELIKVEITSNIIDYEHKKGKLVLVNDRTQQAKAEAELIESTQQLRQLASHLQNIREDERTSMAREIHDELGQQLTGLKMDMAWLNKKLKGTDENIAQKIQGSLELIDHTIITVRKIASDLRPSILDDLGLAEAIDWQSTEFTKRTGIPVKFSSVIHDEKFPPDISIGIFRIFQESLTNIARHANATEVICTFEKTDNHIILKITDNGAGFDVNLTSKRKTLGLLGMRERITMLNGEYEINSKIGEGTTVLIHVPLAEHKKSNNFIS